MVQSLICQAESAEATSLADQPCTFRRRPPTSELNRVIVFVVVAMGLFCASAGEAAVAIYAGPDPLGAATGTTATDAMRFGSDELWDLIRRQLEDDEVILILLNGEYPEVVSVRTIGDERHRLTVQPQNPGRAVFVGRGRFILSGASNLTVRGLTFTGTDPDANIYKFAFGDDGETGEVSHNILVEDCLFHDALVYYGALGVASGSHHVTIHRNTFRNIGSGGTAHMIYTAYDVHHIKVVGNTFENCRGDYVRFRDNADFGEVRFCSFRSTAAEFNRPMIHMPVFNDVNPGDEFHASHYLFTDNTMVYESQDGDPGKRDAMGYHTSGFDPPTHPLLPTPQQAAVMRDGTTKEKRSLFLDEFRIDLSSVRAYRNAITNANRMFHYSANAAYGSPSRGWAGAEEIVDAIVTTPPTLGDLHVDGVLDAMDVDYFQAALKATGPKEFLLSDAIWFGDYFAGDFNSDGKVDQADVPLFMAAMNGRGLESVLKFDRP